jgi:hypothetical protein
MIGKYRRTDSMDAMQFEQQARQDPHLCTFLREVAEDTVQQISVAEPQRFVTVTGAGAMGES